MSVADQTSAWLERSRRRLDALSLVVTAESLGRVESIADGVALVTGLPAVGLDELLEFEGGRTGLVRALDPNSLAAVMLDDPTGVVAGQVVRGSGRVASVPVGDGLLGRVVDSLGRPLDGKGPVVGTVLRPVERNAPGIVERAAVTRPVVTGLLVIDALFALGRGQRELIVGDRATGKSSLALDIIVAQRASDMISVYVAIGQRAADVERAIETIHRHGNADRCIVVVANPSDPPGLQWLAPFAATSMAEHFRDRGGHALIVYDDLGRHAATHRELALLAGESPGREAYPGDIFYLHARLLERSAKLSPARGGGSLTALPIVETDAGDLSAYIPTNLISITDGQIVLDSQLFAANQRPAVDIGTSVSRIGGKTQVAAMKHVAGRVRLDYAQFLELEAFTRFGALVDERTQARVIRGERIRALLVQPRLSGLRSIDEIVLLAALADGVLDTLSPQDVPTLRERIPALVDTLSDEIRVAIEIDATSGGEALAEVVARVRELVQSLVNDENPG